jgi:hypothetical protein
MLIALFTTVEFESDPSLFTDKWKKKMWRIHAEEYLYYSALKETLTPVVT